MGTGSILRRVAAGMAAAALLAVAPFATAAPPSASNGTTLAGYKTIDICLSADNQWVFSGLISVWNEGAINTIGLAITDTIQNKTGTKWVNQYSPTITLVPSVISAGTTLTTATVYPYTYTGAALAGDIRNVAKITITNHSGNLGKAFGPEPKATYSGSNPPPPCLVTGGGCTYTQGYWGNKPSVVWPSPFDRTALFYLSGQTWQGVMDTPVNVSQGYYQLAHQYIAAVLNQANGASVPQGVEDTLLLANAWLTANTPAACTAAGSCGTQKDWAATLDVYNNGNYPGGPPHCGDE